MYGEGYEWGFQKCLNVWLSVNLRGAVVSMAVVLYGKPVEELLGDVATSDFTLLIPDPEHLGHVKRIPVHMEVCDARLPRTCMHACL